MTSNRDYSKQPEVTNAYTGLYPQNARRTIREALRQAGITKDDCRTRVHENEEGGSVQLEIKQPYLKNGILKIVYEALMGKVHSKSNKPTKLRTEVKSPLSLYRA